MAESSQLKKDYLWNTLGSMMNAVASVVLLMVVSQTLGAYQGGIFALAFAIAQQFQTLGQYEMRPFQATDVAESYSFGDYLSSRVITCGLMVLGFVSYALFTNGFGYEALLLILVASLRVFDAFEDVLHGMFQQHGRLDIAGRAFFFRVLVTTVLFAGCVIVSRDILISCVVTIVASTAAVIVLNIPSVKKMESMRLSRDWKRILRLLKVCFPLFIGAFLLAYIANAPKYGIEDCMTKEYQTYYAALFMPAMVINLLSGFIFKPLLTSLAERWNEGQYRAYAMIILKGLGAVAAISVVTILLAIPLGAPILSFLYGVDLGPFRLELIVLLVGGAFNAFSVILYYGLVTMRFQRGVLYGYIVSATIAFLSCRPIISTWGILGASVLYVILMVVLVLVFALISFWKAKRLSQK